MYLRLRREKPDGLAVRGKLYLVTYNILEEREIETLLCATLEHRDYLILPLIYRLAVTYSPKFRRLLPLVCDVPRSLPLPNGKGIESARRTGIRFHPGTRPEHSRGCILVSRADETKLRELILAERETRMEICEP